MEASDLRRMKHLDEEHARLNRMVADLSLTHEATKDFIKKGLVMQQQREALSDRLNPSPVNLRGDYI
jgi:hypothetical protein